MIVPLITGKRVCGKMENRNACNAKRKKVCASKELKQSARGMFKRRRNNPARKLTDVIHYEVGSI